MKKAKLGLFSLVLGLVFLGLILPSVFVSAEISEKPTEFQLNDWITSEVPWNTEANITDPQTIVDGEGIVHLFWEETYDELNTSCFKHCTFDSESFSAPVNLTVFSVDNYNSIYDFYQAIVNEQGQLYYLINTDDSLELYSYSSSSKTFQLVSSLAISTERYHADFSDDGTLHIVWQDSGILFYSSFDGTEWSSTEQISTTGGEDQVYYLAIGPIDIELNINGEILVISNFNILDESGSDFDMYNAFYFFYKESSTSSWKNDTLLDTSQMFTSSRFSLATDETGKIHVYYSKYGSASSNYLFHRSFKNGSFSDEDSTKLYDLGQGMEPGYSSITGISTLIIGSDIFCAFTVTEWLAPAYEYDVLLYHKSSDSDWSSYTQLDADETEYSLGCSLAGDKQGRLFLVYEYSGNINLQGRGASFCYNPTAFVYQPSIETDLPLWSYFLSLIFLIPFIARKKK
jgi:hypothetical protein